MSCDGAGTRARRRRRGSTGRGCASGWCGRGGTRTSSIAWPRASAEAWPRLGVDPGDVVDETVPGSFELPMGARILAASGRVDAVICLGCVIRGETSHYELVAGEAAAGIQQVQLDHRRAGGLRDPHHRGRGAGAGPLRGPGRPQRGRGRRGRGGRDGPPRGRATPRLTDRQIAATVSAPIAPGGPVAPSHHHHRRRRRRCARWPPAAPTTTPSDRHHDGAEPRPRPWRRSRCRSS